MNSKEFGKKVFIEFKAYYSLLRFSKSDLKSYFSSKYRIILILLFFIVFFPNVFVLNENLDLITSLETDPGLVIEAIKNIFENPYNMTTGWISRFWGFTYFALNFFLLTPIYLLLKFNIIKDISVLYFSIRLLLFIIGLLTSLTFYQISLKVLKQSHFALIASISFITSESISIFFYKLHPESTGLLFLFLGTLCLLQYREEKGQNTRWYIWGLVCLVLSALSKQPFFFSALIILIGFLILYCKYNNFQISKFIFSFSFLKSLVYTLTVSLLIFFVINPNAFIDFQGFWEDQMWLMSQHTNSPYTLSLRDAASEWFDIIKSQPFIFISLILSPILVGVAFNNRKETNNQLFLAMLIGEIFATFLICMNARLFLTPAYLSPVTPFFILTLFISMVYIINSTVKSQQLKKTIFLAQIALIIITIPQSINSISDSYNRLFYKETPQYAIYDFLEQGNIPPGSKIAIDHFIPLSSNYIYSICHYWQGCGTDYIYEFEPDYIIYNQDFLHRGVETEQNDNLDQYIIENYFKLVKEFSGRNLRGNEFKLSIWEKSK